jgi:hypothetical protein
MFDLANLFKKNTKIQEEHFKVLSRIQSEVKTQREIIELMIEKEDFSEFPDFVFYNFHNSKQWISEIDELYITCFPSIMIDTLVPSSRAADMQANLAETFPLWVERHGLAAAHRIRKVQIARLIIGEYWNKAIELIKAVKLAGS